ncbi:recombination protein F [compost metagenome]
MSKYSINRIYIENFKSITQAEINVNAKLFILNGPNGFGKTTIFDVIELVLSGKISRVIGPEDQRYGYNDVLFMKDSNKDIVIKVEFYSEDHKFTLMKKLSADKRLTRIEKQPGNWSLFDTYFLENFDSAEFRLINQEEIGEFFGVNNLERLYDLFYYIQQEDNTTFLKKPGTKRMSQISQLFNTKIEEEELEAFEEIKSLLNTERKANKQEQKRVNSLLDTFQKNLEGQKLQKNINYKKLLPDNSIEKVWDIENVTIVNKDIHISYISELDELEDFIIHFDEFKIAQLNHGLNGFSSNTDLLKDIIVLAHFIQDFEGIKVAFERQQKYKGYVNLLSKEALVNNIEKIDFAEIAENTGLSIQIDSIKERLSIIKRLNQSSNELSKIITELNKTREKLLVHYKAYSEKSEIDEKDCPFCGYNWINHDELLQQINFKQTEFSNMLDDSSNQVLRNVDDIFELYLNNICSWLNEYLNDSENVIEEKFFRQLEKANESNQLITRFLKWSSKQEFDFSVHINQDKNKVIDNLEEISEEFKNSILKKKRKVKDGYEENSEKYKRFQNIFKEIFSQRDSEVKLVDIQDIADKKHYMENLFYQQNISQQALYIKEQKKYDSIEKKLKQKNDELVKIIDLYNDSIRTHWKKIMIDIEIPFYIYSGKIIQDYQRGLGLFIKESIVDDTPSITFVSSLESDHDAINYLSSGQLSALVISITLALNKVYGNDNLGALLIDDPVQTMDDINMASFTELLRNEFSEKQLIISTHEEEVSRYLSYKFLKYGINGKRFNVKQDMNII